MHSIIRSIKLAIFWLAENYFACRQNLASFSHWWAIRRYGSQDKVTSIRAFESNKLALFASFESGPNPLLEAELAELARVGFDIIFVSNLPVRVEFQTWLAQWANVVIERPNIARDFGAYKCGYLYALDNGLLEGADQLLFVNDTIFFPLFNAEHFWAHLEVHPTEVIAAYESCAPRRHAQSFFVLCTKGVHRKDFFKNYWRDYVEWNSRRHAIGSGEIGFSSMLLANKVTMGAVVDARHCAMLVREHGLKADTRFHIHGAAWQVPEASVQDHERLQAERQLFDLLETSNPSHTLARFAVTYARLPLLKKDVVYRGTLRLGEVEALHEATGMTLPLKSIVDLLRRKRLPVEKTFFDKLRERAGAS